MSGPSLRGHAGDRFSVTAPSLNSTPYLPHAHVERCVAILFGSASRFSRWPRQRAGLAPLRYLLTVAQSMIASMRPCRCTAFSVAAIAGRTQVGDEQQRVRSEKRAQARLSFYTPLPPANVAFASAAPASARPSWTGPSRRARVRFSDPSLPEKDSWRDRLGSILRQAVSRFAAPAAHCGKLPGARTTCAVD